MSLVCSLSFDEIGVKRVEKTQGRLMAAVLVSPPHSFSLVACPLLLQHPSLSSPSNNVGICSTRKMKFRLRKKFKTCCHAYPDFSSHSQVFRRHLVLFGISSSFSFALPTPSGLTVPEDAKMDSFTDEVNSYSYLYPTTLPMNKIVLKWVESRKPERYSSAAPLSPDARLRIVSERVDIIHNLIISITIGPPNPNFLKTKDKISWNAKDVADSVLSDKSALRVTSAQRLAESSLLNAYSSDVDGEPYWYYDYLVRKSPAKNAQESNLYRHYMSSTAERDGYLYTLNASTLSKQWDVMGPLLQTTAASFRLLPPTDNYVPPFKDPWRFW